MENDSGENVRFFRIPAVDTRESKPTQELQRKRRGLWFSLINRSDINKDASYIRVCGKHFHQGKPAALHETNHPDWAPSLALGYDTRTFSGVDKYQRLKKREQKKRELETASALLVLKQHETSNCAAFTEIVPHPEGEVAGYEFTAQDSSTEQNDTSQLCEPPDILEAVTAYKLPSQDSGVDQSDRSQLGEPPDIQEAATAYQLSSRDSGQQSGTSQLGETSSDRSAGTDISMQDISNLQAENNRLNDKVYKLRLDISKYTFDEDTFRRNEGMVSFYTGLPNFSLLLAVFNLVTTSVPHTPCNSLTKFQEMTLALMRLRLNAPLQDLAYRFRISQPTVTRVLYRWINAMYVRLGGLIKWPSSDCLRKTMPMSFRTAFGVKVAVILDCFEVLIDRPSSLVTRALTWSHYKHHNTVKYLIGISPQGVVTFVSKGWGGRTSDKEVTEHCGILDNLLPGDSVLADKGFTIVDSVGMCRAKLEIPAFTRGKAQLSPWEVENTRRLANVRIHVERVIGLVRTKYAILKSTVPIEMVTTREGDKVPMLDKVVVACCALSNLCNSVVPFD